MTTEEAFSDSRVVRLVDAAVRGDVGSMDREKAAGANVNAVGKDGISPLLWVMHSHNSDGLEHMLELGADPNYRAPNGYSAMSIAAGGDRPKVLQVLLKHGGNPNLIGHDDRPLLHIAVLNMRWEQMKMLLAAGGDINIVEPGTSETAANVAARLGQFEQVNYLLDQGFTAQIQNLAVYVDMSAVPPGSEVDRWKQIVIGKLKSKGAVFPAFIPKRHF